MRIPRGAGLVATLIVATFTQTAAQERPQAPPVFRGGTDLVEIDVVVHARDGAFVGDLSADDFVLEESGRVQPIQQLYVHRGRGAPPSAVQGRERADGDVRPDTPTAAPRVFVVVFDDEHLTRSGFGRAQAAAHSLFATQFQPGDIGGVVYRGRMAQDRLTGDREELLRAVKNAAPDNSRNSRLFDEQQWPRLTEVEAVRIVFNNDRLVLEEAVRRACTDDPDQCRRGPPEAAIRAKASQIAENARVESVKTLRTVSTLASGLASVPGRKTIILLSEGFIAENTWPLVTATVTLAARANARIYTLDARGLDRGLRSVAEPAPNGNDSMMRLLEQMDFGADSVDSLAVDSGGFVVRNTNYFDAALARIVDDADNYYVLGINPGAAADGAFHPVSVKVKRPDVSVRVRRGYVVPPRTAAAARADAATPASAAATATTAAAPTSAAASTSAPAADAASASASAVEDAAASAHPVPPSSPSADATIVHNSETSNGLRLRPDANRHADTLATAGNVTDPDAAAGWDAYQRGDVETARARLSLAAAHHADDAWVYYTLGMSNYALRHFREAVTVWERVRTSVPDFEPVYFDLIDGYLQQKEHDAAIRVARAGIDRWPADPELMNALGVVQTSRGALDDAVKSFQSAVTIAPQDATAYFNLGKALELRYIRSRRYVQQLRSWVSREPDRLAAIENYDKYIAMGGVYIDAARAGVARLNWIPAK